MLQRIHLFICLMFLHCLALSPQAVYANSDITEPWKVVVDIKPLEGLVGYLLKGVGTVETLFEGQSSAHHPQLKPSQMAKLQNATFIIVTSYAFTPELKEMAETVDYDTKIFLLEPPETLPMRGHHSHGEEIDPHIWLDPILMMKTLETLAKELIAVQPLATEDIMANLAQLKFRLFKIDAEIKEVFYGDKATYPKFMAAHDSYQYLEKRYSLTNGAFLVNHPEELTGAAEQLELLSKYEEGDIDCILTDSKTPLIKQLAEKTGADIWMVDPINGAHDTVVASYEILLDSIAKKIRYCK